MWKDKTQTPPIGEYIGWLLFLTILVQGILLLLEPCSIDYVENGKMSIGYVIYAILGMFLSTPSPFLALFLTLRKHEKITLKEYFRRIVHTRRPLMAVLVTGGFCVLAMVFALCCGTRNNSPWYMMPLGFLVMLPFVGIAEEPGWRGFLQPALEKKFPFPVAIAITASVWYIWHLPIWLMPTSNHYGDSLIGFAIMIFVWTFVAAAIYKATESVLACAIYHAFINSIGAVYDWNLLFDAYPKDGAMLLYFTIVLLTAVVICVISKKENMGEEKSRG